MSLSKKEIHFLTKDIKNEPLSSPQKEFFHPSLLRNTPIQAIPISNFPPLEPSRVTKIERHLSTLTELVKRMVQVQNSIQAQLTILTDQNTVPAKSSSSSSSN